MLWLLLLAFLPTAVYAVAKFLRSHQEPIPGLKNEALSRQLATTDRSWMTEDGSYTDRAYSDPDWY